MITFAGKPLAGKPLSTPYSPDFMVSCSLVSGWEGRRVHAAYIPAQLIIKQFSD